MLPLSKFICEVHDDGFNSVFSSATGGTLYSVNTCASDALRLTLRSDALDYLLHNLSGNP